MKECNKCGKHFPPTNEYFHKAKGNKDGLRNGCKKCNVKRVTKYYLLHKDKINANTIKRKRLKKEKAIEVLGGKCSICNEKFPSCCYDFHHKDLKEKDIDPCFIFCWSWGRIKLELPKLKLLCANCHRKVTNGLMKI